MTAIVFHKFQQNPMLLQLLLSTGDRPLCESTRDKCWGIGYSWQEAGRRQRLGQSYLNGDNLMGQILSHVRSLLRSGAAYSRLVIIGDSLTRGAQSDGVKLICIPGARAKQLLLIAHCILQIPGTE